MTEEQKKILTEILLKRITYLDNAHVPKSDTGLLALAAGIQALVALNK